MDGVVVGCGHVFLDGVSFMVASRFSLVKRGVFDWFVQRVTAVILAFYFGFILFYWLLHPGMTHASWQALLLGPLMRIAGVISMLALAWHAWIGIWTVLTDYVKSDAFRLFLQVLVWIALLGDAVWAIYLFLGS
jgi:succinate dehydrogenase / fumarate reductase, membrane anchor subunit